MALATGDYKMTIRLSSKGGGSFTASFASPNISVSSGATGTIATITPPAGKKVKLTGIAGMATQTNLTTITVGGSDVVIAVLLDSIGSSVTLANEFKIGYDGGNQEAIIGKVNEVFEIKTNTSTSSDTLYTYQFGV